MPRGMFLRSGPDWHLDGREVATVEAYVNERGLTTRDTKPLPIEIFSIRSAGSWAIMTSRRRTRMGRTSPGLWTARTSHVDDGSGTGCGAVTLARNKTT